ncbi:MAG: FAD-binding domain-containing protein [Bacteroidales bacterium]|nr:FAD-binding domain-containing protein [Bacteroidales bacterium]
MEATRNIPSIEAGTSKMSTYLRYGVVSIRKLVQKALIHGSVYLNELIWRDFFSQILIHFPHSQNECFKKQYSALSWSNDQNLFEKWCGAQTGFPFVDAGMQELNTTGLMHNRLRMVTAGFLCKNLLIDWRWGEAYFAQKLLDYDLASNVGNWQWAAGTGCDAAPYFRIFNPITQQKNFDPENLYTEKQLKNTISSNTLPIVDLSESRLKALAAYKKALLL